MGLAEALREALRKIARSSRVDEELLAEVIRDLQRALIRADVDVRLVMEVTERIEERALKEEPPKGVSLRSYIISVIHQELLSILGRGRAPRIGPQRIMLVGLYGQGKTTTAGKLARFFKRRGLSVALVCTDTYRPAAFEQLRQVAEQVGVPAFGKPDEGDPVRLVRDLERQFSKYQVVIFDTAGRSALDQELLDELRRLKEVIGPDEVILVLDATMGQQAGRQAEAFHGAVGLTGVILTKMDGAAKGGGALSAVARTGAPVMFIGTGEKLEDLEVFDPDRYLSRLLGLGDVKALMEILEEARAPEEAAAKIVSGRFTLKDLYEVWREFSRPGLLRKLVSSLPLGVADVKEEALRKSEEDLWRFRVIMDSMTEEELENPEIIKGTRILRIARGSGRSPREVRELLKHYRMARKAIKGMRGNRRLRRILAKQLREGSDWAE